MFLADCRRLLAEMEGAIRRAQRVGKSGSAKHAVRPGAGQSVLTGLLNSYAELPGSGPVEILYCYDEVSALHTGAAGVSLMCATGTANGLSEISWIGTPLLLMIDIAACAPDADILHLGIVSHTDR